MSPPLPKPVIGDAEYERRLAETMWHGYFDLWDRVLAESDLVLWVGDRIRARLRPDAKLVWALDRLDCASTSQEPERRERVCRLLMNVDGSTGFIEELLMTMERTLASATETTHVMRSFRRLLSDCAAPLRQVRESRGALLEANAHLVLSIARGLLPLASHPVVVSALVRDGLLGLFVAIQCHDYRFSRPLHMHARPWIEGAILSHIANPHGQPPVSAGPSLEPVDSFRELLERSDTLRAMLTGSG